MVDTGYTVVDCTGLDLIKGSTEQTITGIYKKVQSAVKTDKMIIADNCNWDGRVVTPIQCFAIDFGDYYIITSSTLQIYVRKTDVVTITNLVGE